MISQNRFLQGIYPFEGAGLDKPVPISVRALLTSYRTA